VSRQNFAEENGTETWSVDTLATRTRKSMAKEDQLEKAPLLRRGVRVSYTSEPEVLGKGEDVMGREKKSFWDRLFGGSQSSAREQKVLEYVVHRMNQGVDLVDVVGEEYVRRNASGREIDDILSNPRIVEAAREHMQEAFRSGELNLGKRRSDKSV
jgi:hypothetical protein